MFVACLKIQLVDSATSLKQVYDWASSVSCIGKLIGLHGCKVRILLSTQVKYCFHARLSASSLYEPSDVLSLAEQDLNDYGAILTRHWTFSQVHSGSSSQTLPCSAVSTQQGVVCSEMLSEIPTSPLHAEFWQHCIKQEVLSTTAHVIPAHSSAELSQRNTHSGSPRPLLMLLAHAAPFCSGPWSKPFYFSSTLNDSLLQTSCVRQHFANQCISGNLSSNRWRC